MRILVKDGVVKNIYSANSTEDLTSALGDQNGEYFPSEIASLGSPWPLISPASPPPTPTPTGHQVYTTAAQLRGHKAAHVAFLRKTEIIRELALTTFTALGDEGKRAWIAGDAWAAAEVAHGA